MPKISRRTSLALLSASAAAVLGQRRAWAEASPRLIDVHAHLFNATDIPARSFLKIVVLDHYPEQGVERMLDFGEPGVTDWLVSLFVWIVAGRAPTARAEIDFLSGRGGSSLPASVDASTAVTKEKLRQFLQSAGSSAMANMSVRPNGFASPGDAGREKFVDAIRKAAARGSQLSPDALNDEQTLAEAAFLSPTDVGSYLRWFNLFALYRHALAEQLTATYRTQQLTPQLICPAAVNYSHWLDEYPTSPFADQVEVMGLVAKRSRDVMVHGYIGYDPLAQVHFRRQIAGSTDQLSLIRTAVLEHGFLGVKLYPPMGFKPMGNAPGQTYPQPILDRLGGHVSEGLNEAMEELFALCTQLDIPILAHAAASNGAGPEYADRADPAFWLPVFTKYPTLRLCLAHFGRFDHRSSGAAPGSALPAASWEWELGKFVKSHSQQRLFVDLSYLSQAQDVDVANRKKLGTIIRNFLNEFDPRAERILYGSDWLMLGQESKSDTFATDLFAFLRHDVGLSQDAIERVRFRNAIRFLGLSQGSAARSRLESLYQRWQLPSKRLALFDS